MTMPNNDETYETHTVKLWLDNEQGSYEMCQEMARNAWSEARCGGGPAPHALDAEARAVSLMAERLKETIDEWHETAGMVTGMFADLLNGALREVDWHDIARSYIDEIDKTLPEEG